MTYQLIDYSQSSPGSAIDISSEEQLQTVLQSFQQHEPGFIDLVSPSADTLSLGVGGPLACAMFIGASGDPPYLWALGSSPEDTDIEFARGGTPTPVPLNRCLPFANVVEIAAAFFRDGKLPDNIDWDED